MSINKLESICCHATHRLLNDLKMLQYEVELLNSIDKQSSRLLIELNQISQTVDCKLKHLWLNKIPLEEREIYCSMRRDKVTEFVDFIENVKQFGNDVIGKSVEKVQYISFAEGVPLSNTLQRVKECLYEAGYNLSGDNHHTTCSQMFSSIYNEIVNDLIPRLSNADLSFYYYSLIKRNISFIQAVSNIIDRFMRRPKNYSVFLFCQELLNHCPPIKCDKSCLWFSQLIDYLTGKLTQDSDFLDHHSDIQPIAIDRTVSQDQFLIKQVTCYIFKLIPNVNTISRVEHLLKDTLFSKENCLEFDGYELCCQKEDYKSSSRSFLSDEQEEKKPRKRGRKSKYAYYLVLICNLTLEY